MKAVLLRTAGLASAVFALNAGTCGALPGLSEVWERLYNNNQPFSETNPLHQPSADPDGDGYTNAQESAAGTDPFSGLPPEGFPQLTIAPHLWLENEYILGLPSSRPGKDYLFSYSATLQQGSWTNFPEAFPGTGENLSIPFIPEVEGSGELPEKAFFRATVSDQPNPGGLFTPWELTVLSTHPDIADAIITPPPDIDGPDIPPPDPNSDQAGPSDSYDASPNDDKINWFRTPEAKYIYVGVSGIDPGFRAVAVSDSGKILFSRQTTMTDPANNIVGYVWDPAAPEASRIAAIKFQPQPFELVVEEHTQAGVTYPSEEAPLPVANGAPANQDIEMLVDLRALGDDGSLLADVSYFLYDDTGNSEGLVRTTRADLVFLRAPGGAFKMLGVNRGLRNGGQDVTRDFSVGFYSVTSPAPATLAVSTEQVYPPQINAVVPLSIRTTRTSDLIPNYLSGQVTRKGNRLPTEGRITRNGRVILPDLQDSASCYVVCGATETLTLPPGTFADGFSDLPEGTNGSSHIGDKWGIGTTDQPFRIRDGSQFVPVASAQNVLQWDRYGTGIGPSATQAIWRNGRIYALASVVASLPSNQPDVKPKAITPSGLIWIGDDAGANNGLLVPIEVVTPDLDADDNETEYPWLGVTQQKGLRVAKMERSLTSAGLNIDADPHRFSVRIPAKVGGSAEVQLATVENPDPLYNDGADVIHLNAAGDHLQSQSMILVSDDVDDAADGVDNRADDRTHKIQLRGSVQIPSVKIGGTSYPLDLKIPVKPQRKLNGKIIVVGDAIEHVTEILKYRDIAKERYAQLGVDFNLSITSMDVPEGINQREIHYDRPGNMMESNHPKVLVDDDVKKLVDKAITEGKRDTVTVFVVMDTFGPSAKGFSQIKNRTLSSEIHYANVAVISAKKTIIDSTYPFTLAHEVGHIVTDAGHYDLPDSTESATEFYGNGTEDQIEHNLMRRGTSAENAVGSSKRMYALQRKMLLNELFVDP